MFYRLKGKFKQSFYNKPHRLQVAGIMFSYLQDEEFSLTGRTWQYRGEGNANIVISLPEDRKILRLRKSTSLETTDDTSVLQRMEIELKFIDVVMRAVLGDEFVNLPSLIMLSKEDIDLLNSNLFSVRPEFRRGKHISSRYAQICKDSTVMYFGPFGSSASVCVEIKPKQGIFPSSPSKLRSGKCSFCWKQQLKLKEGLVSSKSQYCPLDLFSGHQPRMVRAIHSLLQTPQNNLKIFMDGSVIYGDGSSPDELDGFLSGWLGAMQGVDYKETFSSLLVKALLAPFTYKCATQSADMSWKWDCTRQDDQHEERKIDHFNMEGACDWTCTILPMGCVLQCLSSAQAVDLYGLDYVSEIYSEYGRIRDYDQVTEKSALKDLNYVHKVLDKKCSSALDPVEAYLIASTARDCSILVTFQKSLENGLEKQEEILLPLFQGTSKTNLSFKITIVDIDPKPFSCISNQILKRNACSEANKGTL